MTYRSLWFVFDYSSDQDKELESYPGSLIQVLTNLIDNACVHGYQGSDHGEIDIMAGSSSPGSVTIRIRDHGQGIPKDNHSRIFEPFFTTRLGSGGTGLGLNIVHSIVEKILGGQIRLESDVGQGAEFIVTVPVKAPENISDADHLMSIES